jgi:hypothetical protein
MFWIYGVDDCSEQRPCSEYAAATSCIDSNTRCMQHQHEMMLMMHAASGGLMLVMLNHGT